MYLYHSSEILLLCIEYIGILLWRHGYLATLLLELRQCISNSKKINLVWALLGKSTPPDSGTWRSAKNPPPAQNVLCSYVFDVTDGRIEEAVLTILGPSAGRWSTASFFCEGGGQFWYLVVMFAYNNRQPFLYCQSLLKTEQALSTDSLY